MWIYIFVNDCPINIFVCSNHMVLMLLPFQGVFFLCPITQGAATLYPGLCASAPSGRAGCNVRDGRTRNVGCIDLSLRYLAPLSPWRGAGGEAFVG